MNNYMGVDIGTSGCKAGIFDENGKQIALAYREYDVISRNLGWAELDTDEVITKCFDVIREAGTNVEAGSIVSLAISSQGEAFVAINEQGKAISNAFVSSDMRAIEYISKFAEQVSEEKLYDITGHTAHTMFSLYKMLWLKENKPEIWSQANKFLCFEDLLQFRLGIEEPAINWSLACRTMLFDVKNHSWSVEILEAVGVKESQLARPLQSGSVAGCISKDIAKNLGLPENVVVATGGHDQPCSALGAGAVEPGVAVYATGTVDCITPAFKEAVFSDELKDNNLCTYDHVVPGLYATVAFSLTGGNILKWFRDEFGYEEIEKAKKAGCDPYELLLKKAGHLPSDLLVLPYFTPTGTPYFDPHASGAILGLKLSTKKGDVIRALLEGVAFEIRLNLEILEKSGCQVNELRVIGGGAKSDIWNQLKADVTGKTIAVLDITEAACMGAAMLAKTAKTGENLGNITAKWVKSVSTKMPNLELHDIYNQKFKKYRKLYSHLKDFRF